jgi:hypothetical protein
MQNHTFVGTVKAVDRADGHTRRVAAMHACHRDGFFTWNAVVQGDHAAAVDAPRDFVFVFASRYTAVAFDAALCITDKFHACHGLIP